MLKDVILFIFFFGCFANGFFDLIIAVDNDLKKLIKWIRSKI